MGVSWGGGEVWGLGGGARVQVSRLAIKSLPL